MLAAAHVVPVMFPLEMTAPTILDPRKLSRTLYAQGGISEYATSKNDKGNTIVHGLKVFRSGTFRDSMGIQRTWEPDHMTQMVSNFQLLRGENGDGIFPNVPVRDKHEGFLGNGGDPVGYVTDLKAVGGKGPDGEDVVFLVADFEFTEPDAAAKLERGTFRARSAEVGVYETNGEAFYWPVFLGFAFVAIGAVEGLYNQATPESSSYSIITEGTKMPDPAVPPAGPQPVAHQFSIAGRLTNDYAAVQAHITAMETENQSLRQFRDDAESVGRENFVRSLATGDAPKMFAAQVEPIVALVKTMDDAQYEAWKKVYDDMPGIPALGKHSLPDGSTGTPGGGGGGGTPDADAQAARDYEEQIKRHKRAGAKDEQIAKMGCFTKLQALYSRRPDLKSAV